MQPQQLDSLGERLLRAGIAPRHVKRYLRELRDHYDDLVQAAIQKGASGAAAEEGAASRLGEPERLMQSALARPELRSTVARHPRLVLGAGPVLIWLATLALVFSAFLGSADVVLSHDMMRAMSFQHGLFVFLARVFPVVLILGVLLMALRQRLSWMWPMVGAVAVALLAGTVEISFERAATAADSSLGIGSWVLSFFLPPAVAPIRAVDVGMGLLRTALMLALTVAPVLAWKRRQG